MGTMDFFIPIMMEHGLKKIFNGEIVQSITGLKGKELGDFMKKFKFLYPDDEIIKKTSEEIHHLIQSQFEILKK